jgi:hypothetical protein
LGQLSTEENSLAVPLVVVLLLAATGSPSGLPGGENLFRGPARCVLSYLEAVRLAGPRGPVLGRHRRPLEQDYRAARALIAPRTLAEIDHLTSRGQEHPLASWRAAAEGLVLESFSLLEVRRAPRGAAVVTARERWRQDGSPSLGVTVSEYLVARVGGEWKVVDRRTGERFQERDIAEGYNRWFDEPPESARR